MFHIKNGQPDGVRAEGGQDSKTAEISADPPLFSR
jgi:hypothetical protein